MTQLPAVKAPIEIRILGQFLVKGYRGEGLGSTEGRTHVRALLALTASSRHGAVRDEVTDVLWPQLGDSAARNRLYHTMHLARQSLSAVAWPDEWIFLKQGRIQLDERIFTDAQVVENVMDTTPERMMSAKLLAALDEIRGDWAPEVEAGGLGHTLRRQFRQWHVVLLTEAAKRRLQTGDSPILRQLLARIIDVNATDEWAALQLMKLDFGAGRYHAVLNSFERTSRELVQELGLRPSPELNDLVSSAAARLAPDTAPTTSSRGAADTLVGREPVIHELLDALSAGPGVWNVHGLGGIGKTVLMQEVARRAETARRDGAVIVRIAAADAPVEGPDALVKAIARGLGIHLGDADACADEFRRRITTTDQLIVLDDIDRHTSWRDFLRALPSDLSCRIVAVSHRSAGSPNVQDFRIGPLELPDVDATITVARQASSVALYQMRRPVADIEDWTATHWAEVIALMRALDGIPLAIEQAAARSSTMTTGEILADIDQTSLDMQMPGSAWWFDGDCVDAALDVSVASLGEPALRIYWGASALTGWFTPDECVAVARAAGLHPGVDLQPLLEELQDAGLVERAGHRLRMLQLPRTHARSGAQRAGVWKAIQHARFREVAASLGAYRCGFDSPGFTRWMDHVHLKQDEALLLLGASTDFDDGELLEMLLPLLHLWSLRGQATRAMAWWEASLAAASRSPSRDAAVRLHVLKAMLHAERDEFEPAMKEADDALLLLDDTVPATLRADAHASRVAAAVGLGSAAGEAVALENLLETLDDPGQPGHWVVRTALLDIGPPASSLAGGIEPMPSLDMLQIRLGGSWTWCRLLVALSGDQPNRTVAYRLEAAQHLLVAASKLRAPRLIHVALSRQARTLLASDRVDDGRKAAIEWYGLARVAGESASAAFACLALAELEWRTDQAASAQQWLETARRLGGDLPKGRLHVAIALHEIAVALLQDDLEGAVRIFLSLPFDVATSSDGETFERLVEDGALLARSAKLHHVAVSLTLALRVVSGRHPPSSLVETFRTNRLGNSAGATAASSEKAFEGFVFAARTDLTTLRDYFSNRLRHRR